MVAEAYIRKKDYGNAITYLNMVRDRAGYKAGEDRSISRDGGQAYKKNSACTGKGGGFSAEVLSIQRKILIMSQTTLPRLQLLLRVICI